MTGPVVLDADGLSALSEAVPPERLMATLAAAADRRLPVLVPAVVCAEVCRGGARTHAVLSALARRRRPGRLPAIEVVDTDLGVARRVGSVLHAAGAAKEDLVDAHVVACCVPYGAGVVITSDPTDILRLAASLPSTRIVTRRPA